MLERESIVESLHCKTGMIFGVVIGLEIILEIRNCWLISKISSKDLLTAWLYMRR